MSRQCSQWRQKVETSYRCDSNFYASEELQTRGYSVEQPRIAVLVLLVDFFVNYVLISHIVTSNFSSCDFVSTV